MTALRYLLDKMSIWKHKREDLINPDARFNVLVTSPSLMDVFIKPCVKSEISLKYDCDIYLVVTLTSNTLIKHVPHNISSTHQKPTYKWITKTALKRQDIERVSKYSSLLHSNHQDVQTSYNLTSQAVVNEIQNSLYAMYATLHQVISIYKKLKLKKQSFQYRKQDWQLYWNYSSTKLLIIWSVARVPDHDGQTNRSNPTPCHWNPPSWTHRQYYEMERHCEHQTTAPNLPSNNGNFKKESSSY